MLLFVILLQKFMHILLCMSACVSVGEKLPFVCSVSERVLGVSPLRPSVTNQI